MRHASWSFMRETDEFVFIDDVGDHTRQPTITNDSEYVVSKLKPYLRGKGLIYRDSDGGLTLLLQPDEKKKTTKIKKNSENAMGGHMKITNEDRKDLMSMWEKMKPGFRKNDWLCEYNDDDVRYIPSWAYDNITKTITSPSEALPPMIRKTHSCEQTGALLDILDGEFEQFRDEVSRRMHQLTGDTINLKVKVEYIDDTISAVKTDTTYLMAELANVQHRVTDGIFDMERMLDKFELQLKALHASVDLLEERLDGLKKENHEPGPGIPDGII